MRTAIMRSVAFNFTLCAYIWHPSLFCLLLDVQRVSYLSSRPRRDIFSLYLIISRLLNTYFISFYFSFILCFQLLLLLRWPLLLLLFQNKSLSLIKFSLFVLSAGVQQLAPTVNQHIQHKLLSLLRFKQHRFKQNRFKQQTPAIDSIA